MEKQVTRIKKRLSIAALKEEQNGQVLLNNH